MRFHRAPNRLPEQRRTPVRRRLAVAAIGALVVTGLGPLAPASGVPMTQGLGAAEVELLSQAAGSVNARYDGVDNAVTLFARGGADVRAVSFEYRPAGGTGWTPIGAATRAGSTFTRTWVPDNILAGTRIDLRAVHRDGDTVVDESLRQDVLVRPAGTGDTVKLTPPARIGVFQQQYGDDGAALLGTVSGRTSLPHGERVRVRGLTGGAGDGGQLSVERAEGAAYGTFSGPLDLTGYELAAPPAGVNEVALSAATPSAESPGSDDVVAATVYPQRLTRVTAVPAATDVTPSGPLARTTVTVTVTDQEGRPIRGAEVRGAPADQIDFDLAAPVSRVAYTDGAGQVRAEVGSGVFTFYANADAEDRYDAAQGDVKSADVTITESAQVLRTITATADLGAAQDIDEVDDGGYTIATTDQAGRPVPNVPVVYSWAVQPFDTAVQRRTSGEAQVTTGADGTARVAFPLASAFARTGDASPYGRPSGTYTLSMRRPASAGQPQVSGTAAVVKVGQGRVVWTPAGTPEAPATVLSGGSEVFTGTFRLEDGTPVGSIVRPGDTPDHVRAVSLTYARGTEPGGGDSGLAAQSLQPDTGVVITNATSGRATLGADGSFRVRVADSGSDAPTAPTPQPERGARLTATPLDSLVTTTPGRFLVPGTTNANPTSVVIDFAADPTAAAIELGEPQALFAAGATPGRPVTIPVTVRNPQGAPLAGKEVRLTVDGGAFFTPTAASAAQLTAAAAGGAYGRWQSNGSVATVTTDAAGVARVTVALERSVGLDDDFAHVVRVRATHSTLSATRAVTFRSVDPLNLSALTVGDAQAPATYPQVRTGATVSAQVHATDQFGNLTQVAANATDGTSPALVVLDGDRTQATGTPPALRASAAGDAVQRITVTATGNRTTASMTDQDTTRPGVQVAPTTTAQTLSQELGPITWYVVDGATSTATLSSTPQRDRYAPRAQVTQTLTALDRYGHPIADATVRWSITRDGGASTIQTGRTDVQGRARLVVTAAETGAAAEVVTVTAQLTELGLTATDELRFAPARTRITARLAGTSGPRADRLRVVAPARAAGARVDLYVVADGKRRLVRTARLNASGVRVFRVRDARPRQARTFVARVRATGTTFAVRTNRVRIR